MSNDDRSESNQRPGSRSRLNYLREIHLELVAVLVVICVILVAIGWSLRPQSSGFPIVPEDLSLVVTAHGAHAVSETLRRSPGGGATLGVLVGNPTSPSSRRWTLEVDNLGAGRVCTPSAYLIEGAGFSAVDLLAHQRVSRPVVATTSRPVAVTEIQSHGLFYVRLCWSSKAPVRLSGSYLSAQFPPVETYPALSVTRTLYANGGDTANYVVQSPTLPTSSSSQSWNWSSRVGAYDPIRLSAVNTSGIQHDNFRGFLSGLALGIAGGALISILQELVAPLSRRRDTKYPI